MFDPEFSPGSPEEGNHQLDGLSWGHDQQDTKQSLEHGNYCNPKFWNGLIINLFMGSLRVQVPIKKGHVGPFHVRPRGKLENMSSYKLPVKPTREHRTYS